MILELIKESFLGNKKNTWVNTGREVNDFYKNIKNEPFFNEKNSPYTIEMR